jgi:hypothetical protein
VPTATTTDHTTPRPFLEKEDAMSLMKENKKKRVAVINGEPVYLDGYVPSSWDSHHSSLMQGWTWIGMGVILSSLAGFGVAIFGFTSAGFGGSPESQPDGNVIGLVGLIVGVLMLAYGGWSIHHGRAAYRRYKESTGRVQ